MTPRDPARVSEMQRKRPRRRVHHCTACGQQGHHANKCIALDERERRAVEAAAAMWGVR